MQAIRISCKDSHLLLFSVVLLLICLLSPNSVSAQSSQDIASLKKQIDNLENGLIWRVARLCDPSLPLLNSPRKLRLQRSSFLQLT
jgi:hypothetical protein